jgi:hypothetical protein
MYGSVRFIERTAIQRYMYQLRDSLLHKFRKKWNCNYAKRQ